MSNYQSHSQFRPPFSTGALRDNENDVHMELLHDATTIFNYPRMTAQSLPGLQPVQEQTKSLVIQPEQWRGSLIPFTPPSTVQHNFIPSRQPVLKKKTILIASITSLLIVVLCFIWISVKAAVPDVTLYQVGEQNVTQYSGGGGIVFPRQQFTLSYPVVKYALDVLVKAGDQVSLNQPLLKLDPTRLNAQITQMSDDVAAAQAYLSSVSTTGNAASIAQAQQQYTLAKSKYNALVARVLFPFTP